MGADKRFKKLFSFCLDEETYEKIKTMSKQRKSSAGAVVRELVDERLSEIDQAGLKVRTHMDCLGGQD